MAEDDLALGGDDLPARAQVLQDGGVGGAGGGDALRRAERAGRVAACGGAYAVAVDEPARRGGTAGERAGAASGEEGQRVDRDAGGGQLGERAQQRHQPVLAGGGAADGGVRAVAEDRGGEVGQGAAGTRLHERAGSRVVHRLDLLGDVDGRGRRRGQVGRVRLVRAGRRVRPDREGGRAEVAAEEVVAGRGRAGAHGADVDHVGVVDDAGGAERGEFAVAVAGGEVGVDADGGEQAVHGQARDAGALVAPAGEAQQALEAGEGDEEIGDRAGPPVLVREQEGDLAGLAGREADAPLGAELRGEGELLAEVVRPGRRERRLHGAFEGRGGPGEIAQAGLPVVQEPRQPVDLLPRGGPVVAADQEQLGGPLGEARHRFGSARIAGEDGVIPRAAEPGGAHAREPVAGAGGPGAGRPGEHARVQRAGDLDQLGGAVRPGQPGGRRRHARPLVRALMGGPAAGSGDGLDHRVDPVAVALGVGEAFEDDAGDALVRGGRQVVQAGAHAERHGARTRHEVLAGGVEGREGRPGDGAGRSAEAEAVGDPRGGRAGGGAVRGVPGRTRELLVQPGREPAEIGRERRAQGVRGAEVAAALGGEEHRGPGPVERPVGVARVPQRAGRDLQRQQLHGVDAADRVGGDAVGRRVERDGGKTAARLAGAADDARPVAVGVAGARGDAAHADDRDAGRARGFPRGVGGPDAQLGGARREERGRAGGDLLVQVGDPGPGRAQRRRLPHRVHAFGALPDGVDGRAEPQSPARQVQAPGVQLLQAAPHLRLRRPGLLQLAAGLLERFDVGGAGAADRLPGGGLQQGGALAGERDLLVAGRDGAGRDRLLREQVGGAHQDADVGAALGQRPGQRGDHRGGPLVVDAAREHQRQLTGVAAEPHQPFDLRVPQRETRVRPDGAAALAAREDELPRALAEEPAERLGRRGVQVGGDPGGLERRGLRGVPRAGDRVRGAGVPDGGELLRAQFRRRPGGDRGAPGTVAEPVGGLPQQRPHPAAVHRAERQEGQAAVLRDRARERRPVADLRHRPLHGDRDGARRQRLGPHGGPQVRGDLLADGLDHSPGRLVAADERRRRRVEPAQVHLPDAGELLVQDDPGRAAGDGRRGRVGADAARRVHRDVEVGQQPLEQDERGHVAAAARDDPDLVGQAAPDADGGRRLGGVRDLDQQAAPPGDRGDVEPVAGRGRGGVHDDGAGGGRDLRRADAAPGRDADAERARPPAAHVGERGERGRPVGAEVEDPRPAGARDGHGEMGHGPAGRGGPDDLRPGAFRGGRVPP